MSKIAKKNDKKREKKKKETSACWTLTHGRFGEEQLYRDDAVAMYPVWYASVLQVKHIIYTYSLLQITKKDNML